MSITSIDGLINSLANRSQSVVLNKASISNTLGGAIFSMWRAGGIPGPGAIPTSAAICSRSLAGALAVSAATDQLYMGRAFFLSSVAATDLQIHDRLAHMGGLSGILATSQTVALSLDSTANNLVERIGQSDFSDVQWWLEWYTDTGSTARVATCNVTYGDDTTDSIAVILPSLMRSGRLMPIYPATGKFIKSVTSVTLNGTTGTAGNFGVTATRSRTSLSLGTANSGVVANWADLGLPKIADNCCLQVVVSPGGTTSGTLYGTIKLIEG